MSHDENESGFISHIAELRKRLIHSFIFLIIFFIGCYFFAELLYGFLVDPYAQAVKNDGVDRRLIFTALQETFLTYLKVSFFQPYWISETLLVCSEDSTGWWNLLFLDVSEIDNIFIKKRVERNLIEYGAPQWVSGITFFSGTLKNLFCLAKKENNLSFENLLKLAMNYLDMESSNIAS